MTPTTWWFLAAVWATWLAGSLVLWLVRTKSAGVYRLGIVQFVACVLAGTAGGLWLAVFISWIGVE